MRRADRPALVEYAAAVAENAAALLADADFLLTGRRWARSYSLAVLAAEEWAKAYAVLTLSFMPPEMRHQISVRDFLEGHRLKMTHALLLRTFDGARPGVVGRIAGTPALADVFEAAYTQAGDANVAKQRGLYVDLLADGTLALPADVSEDEARKAVAQAREVGASAALLKDQDALAKFVDPPAEALALAEALLGQWAALEHEVDVDDAAAMISDVAARLTSDEGPPEV